MLTQIANGDVPRTPRAYEPLDTLDTSGTDRPLGSSGSIPHSEPFRSPRPTSSFWPRVRAFAVPPSMIETATARRHAGDWAGACAAAHFDVDFSRRAVARTHGRDIAAQLRSDLRHLAPDLLRWHMPRIASDGLLRPGLTLALTRYGEVEPGGAGPLYLVARTPPAWADAGQRISLALWDGSLRSPRHPHTHPHPHPHRRFRLDLHRHLWDARRTDELWTRSGADRRTTRTATVADQAAPEPELPEAVPRDLPCAVDRWAAEADLLLRADGRPRGPVVVRLGTGRRLLLEPEAGADGTGPHGMRIGPAPDAGDIRFLPVLPDAATWTVPDLDLIRTGTLTADGLHPLVASALVPGFSPPTGPPPTDPSPAAAAPANYPHLVECRGALHRIALVEGQLAALDHHPDEIRREELLAALSGTPLPCLQAIDAAHRRPDCLTGVRERLDHGDLTGALAVVENLLGPEAKLRDGPLRDELETAARRRVVHGLYRAGLINAAPSPPAPHGRQSRHGRGPRSRATTTR
ncbi:MULTISPECIES: hypothetical protein [unclassified Streptomyces]|uniref:hypothetical protein n=1 Tax=unclassified Streptomyces TaxID=2593676 RepID=UPI0033D5E2B4